MKLVSLGVLCVMACAQLSAQNGAAIAHQFQNPPKAYRPMVRWWWPGGNVTDAELRHEVDLLIKRTLAARKFNPLRSGSIRRCLRPLESGSMII